MQMLGKEQLCPSIVGVQAVHVLDWALCQLLHNNWIKFSTYAYLFYARPQWDIHFACLDENKGTGWGVVCTGQIFYLQLARVVPRM